MLPPDRFYYNLGEWFRDMNESQQPDEEIDFFSMGQQVGLFFQGILSSVKDSFIAMKLTGDFIRTQFGSDDDLGIVLSDDQGDSDK